MPFLSARARRRMLWALLGLLIVIGGVVGYGWWWLRSVLSASQPRLSGEYHLAGLEAPVVIERDAAGVPTIRAESRVDLAFALGFLHAQERFFQMDLTRRSAAGELSELVGEATVEQDREVRVHQFRQRAVRAFKLLPPDQALVLRSYTAGVNAGLADLAGWPFEYHLLGQPPALWQVEDCLLINYAMYLMLQNDIWEREAQLAELRERLPGPLFDFLTAPGDEWDAPLEGEPWPLPPLPGPEVFDLRRTAAGNAKDSATGSARGTSPAGTKLTATATPSAPAAPSQPSFTIPKSTPTAAHTSPGSNNWVVSGRHTHHGSPIVANDMHLGLSLPNTWYRACFFYPDPKNPQQQRRAVGVTLPGVPVLIVGSTGHIAWGFTNTQADWADLVVVEFDRQDPTQYQTPHGFRTLEREQEVIRVKGGLDRIVTVEKTIWGPLIDRDHAKRRRALRWVAHDPEGANLRLADLLIVDSVAQAMEVVNQAGMPHQNFVVADRAGTIGWTVTGRIPRRLGGPGWQTTSWADGQRDWKGFLEPAEYPRIINPPSGRLWTANNRTTDGRHFDLLGYGAYDRGARARQIRDRLFALDQVTEKDMLNVQLDDRALFLERWQKLFLDTLRAPDRTLTPALEQARELVANWGGRATPDSVGFRLVYQWRRRVQHAVIEPLTRTAKGGAGACLDSLASPPDGPVWRILQEKPLHLLNPSYQRWETLLFHEIQKLVEELAEQSGGLAARTWGEANTVTIAHPLTRAVSLLGPWLNAPPLQLPGAPSDLPRIQKATFGASERLVVSPGKEEQGIFHMPGGQSGHPDSPNYLSALDAWAKGEPTPLLPGPPVHRLTLHPKK